MDEIAMQPAAGPIDATVTVPGSKSFTNRALLIAGLARGRSVLTGALRSDDTRHMAAALRALGIPITETEEEQGGTRFTVEGQGGTFPVAEATLDIGASGTAARFLTAALTLGQGRYTLDGTARMRQRPIAPLLDALAQLGATAYSREGTGCPPVVVEAHGLPGEYCRVRGDISSQYLSALLMVAPYAGRRRDDRGRGRTRLAPLHRDDGGDHARFRRGGDRRRAALPGAARPLRGREYAIEPDASSASYFFAAAAVTGGTVRVAGLGRGAVQGDLAFVDVLEQMGCAVERADDAITVRGPAQLAGIEVDMRAIPDTAQTLAAIAPLRQRPGDHARHWRSRATTRPTASSAVTTELRRLGVSVEEREDGLTIFPATLHGGTVATYDDHRMAMSFALVGLRVPGIRIADPGCVAKTFPDFFERLATAVAGAGRGR